jgi:rod shape determining protein RodA
MKRKSREHSFVKNLDWWSIAIYIILVLIGWLSVFSAVYDPEHSSVFDTTQRYGMQMIWIIGAWLLAFAIMLIPSRTYLLYSNLIYFLGILLLISVLFIGVERNGSRSWIMLGPVHFQPAEMAKVFVSIGLAGIMSRPHFHIKSARGLLQASLLILLPAVLILLEKEAGLAVVLCAFIFVLYREGLSGWVPFMGIVAVVLFLLSVLWEPIYVLWLCFLISFFVGFLESPQKRPALIVLASFTGTYFLIPLLLNVFSVDLFSLIARYQWFLALTALLSVILLVIAFRKKRTFLKILVPVFVGCVLLVFSVDYLFNNLLKPHQQARIETLLGIDKDIYGSGYNVYQSKVAIGSGGFSGKGFLQGTQTKYNFVPEQSTDFIFCSIGEEWGFLGALFVIILYAILLFRVIQIAERQRHSFGRIYGYGVAACMFFHIFINIGMTIGLTPVIGITLPFISYGGSSLWTFTLLLFILLKLDTDND